MSKIVEPVNALAVDHILIRDAETKKTIVNQRGTLPKSKNIKETKTDGK